VGRIYIHHDTAPLVLRVRAIPTGVESEIALDDSSSAAGGFIWSPDESQVIFGAWIGPDEEFAVAWLDLNSRAQAIFQFPQPDVLLDPLAWVDDRDIVLEERRGEHQRWLLNLETGAFDCAIR
jgi:hypothetical protein